jgi:serine/threonine-protein kinase
MIGRFIEHYRITAKIEEGGMGVVYRATDTKLDREVAVKVLPAVFANNAGRMARFEREPKVPASFNHIVWGGLFDHGARQLLKR